MTVSDLKVLVVDDVRDGADTLAELLRLQLHCNVATAYSGQAAVEAACDFVPDIVITDFTMPGEDGLSTARRILAALAARPPMMLLMTADPVVAEDLDAVDKVFDHAFAKPVDLDRLLQLAERHAGRSGPPGPQPVGTDAFEILTDSMRQVVPRVKARGLTFSFDCRGPRPFVQVRATSLGRVMDRAVNGLVDAVQRGFVSVCGEVVHNASGLPELTVTIAGTGRLCSDADADALLRRLGLRERPHDGRGATKAADGVCLETGARFEFTMNRSEGVMLRWRLEVPPGQMPASAPMADARGASAWIVDATGEGVAGLVGRLLRMGWRVAGLASCTQALDILGDPPAPSEMPTLIVVLDADATAAALHDRLRAAAPATRIVYTATGELAGRLRTRWGKALATHGFPFSPVELESFTQAASVQPAHRRPADGDARPPADAPASRRSVLLVDDNEVNRLVGRALVETLGYEVVTCSDGLDAIVQCGRQAPDFVLMDIDMGVLDGYDATRRLRMLQAAGRLPPFSIVACTSQDRDARRADDAGLDGFLNKPLDRDRLAAELQRLG